MTFGPLSSSPSDGGGPPYLAPCCAGETLTLAAEIPDAIVRAIRQREQMGDAAGERVASDLATLADLLGGAVREWLEREGPSGVRGRALAMSLQDALAILDGIEIDGVPYLRTMREQWASDLSSIAASVLRDSIESGLTGLDTEAWAQVQTGALQNAASTWDTKVRRALAEAVQRASMEAMYVTPSVVGQRIRDMVQDLTPATVTEARTATAAYDRTVQAGIAHAADPTGRRLVYVSVGPVDGLQRPFCAAVVGKSWTLDQLGALRNGIPGMPVVDFHGGYNCRHHWVPMLSTQADRNGYEAATAADVMRVNSTAGRRKR